MGNDMAVKDDDPRVGTILVDRYQIHERLSAGAMGVVYKAERLKLGRVVAIKFLHSAFAFSSDFTKRFDLEARTMSRLDHPHCVSVIDFGMADAPFIVMDFVTGTTLKDLLVNGPLPPVRALAIVRQILAGLAHAHEKGIVHRDVKPANIMLTQATGTGDHVRILDFGLAKLVDAEASMSSVVVGTPSYMSPEQAGARKVDARSDIYATAVVLFELLTGDKPFHSEQALQLIRMHMEKEPPTLRERRPQAGFSDELEAAVRRGLAKAPGDRFQTPEDFAAALEATPEASSPRASTARVQTAPAAFPPARVATAAGFAHAATMAAPAPQESHGSWLPWILALAVGFGGLYTWNALGRPGLGGHGVASKKSAAAPGVTLVDAKKLIAAGQRGPALSLLNDLRRKDPGNFEISLLLGGLYFEQRQCAEAMAAYTKAFENGYSRASGQVVKQIIDCVGDDGTQRAEGLVRKRLGATVLPQLREAARAGSDKHRRVAAQLEAELGR